jgi:hypothetical protein
MNLFIVIIFAGNVEILEIEVIVVHARHRCVDRLNGFDDAFFELVLFYDDRIDAQACLELDVIDRSEVGGIGNTQKQALAALYQWQYAVLVDQFLVDGAYDVNIDVYRVEVE